MNERSTVNYERGFETASMPSREAMEAYTESVEAYANRGGVEKSLARTAMDERGVVEGEPDAAAIAQAIFEAEMYANGKESIKRPDGLAYAQDQEVYKPYAALATNIIMEAFVMGDLSILDRIPNADIRQALRDRIESGNNEIDKMISVACIGLAPNVE